jgi:hypothetical protein
MFCGMMFREIISFVHVATFPKHVKLALAHMVMDPVKAHVNGFGPLLFDSISGDASGGAVVSLWIGIASWGWPSSSRQTWIGQASLPLKYVALSLALAALDKTLRMI